MHMHGWTHAASLLGLVACFRDCANHGVWGRPGVVLESQLLSHGVIDCSLSSADTCCLICLPPLPEPCSRTAQATVCGGGWVC